MLFTVSVQLIGNAVNASLKSRVRENLKHGSVGGGAAIELNLLKRIKL